MDLGALSPFFLPIILVVSMYFMLIRPQKKREREATQMLSALKEGDEIVTIGGVVGKVVNIKDDELTIESGVEKTQVKMMKWSVKQVLNKTA